jgi:3'-5' exoribonuclease
MLIKDFQDGVHLRQPFLVNQVNKGMTAAGQPYLTINLQDKTGWIEGKLWDVKPDIESMIEPGSFVMVDGDVVAYRQSLQIKINQVQKLNPDSLDVSMFTMAAPVPLKTLEEQLKQTIQSIQDDAYRGLVETLIKKYYDAFILYPAAVRNHHEYISGLLYHTLSMIKVAEVLLPLYQPLQRDLVIAGILLHDLGKTQEFTSAVIPRYSTEGKLIGHINLMAGEILSLGQQRNIDREKVMLLQHLVLSHHGKPEFGSAVAPATKEALFVHMVDDFDAKMTMVEKALDPIEPGSFTPRVFALDERSFYKAKK